MFISVLDLFKIGIGPSSSHTMGPMLALLDFRDHAIEWLDNTSEHSRLQLQVELRGSLSYTGRGHATDRGIMLGAAGHRPDQLDPKSLEQLCTEIESGDLLLWGDHRIAFKPEHDIHFHPGPPLSAHPNGLVIRLIERERVALQEIYFSVGGGFIQREHELLASEAETVQLQGHPFPFASGKQMLKMAESSGLSVAAMKRRNERHYRDEVELDAALDRIWSAMEDCVEAGLRTEGTLPGGLEVKRRAPGLYRQLQASSDVDSGDWLCAYAMAVNEENAAGRAVVTAPTNGAAGVIPAVLYYFVHHKGFKGDAPRRFLLTAAAIGGLIKHSSSISGAEVGCQGEVGSAAAMAAAGLCEILGGDARHVENAAEIALEHHLGMTCDPVQGLVQVPCIERNGFGAIKAVAATRLALRGSGDHMMPLDACIRAMKQTGHEMSEKYKETSLGGLAVNYIEC